MNNFKLHEQAEQMAAGNSTYKLARRVIELEGQMEEAKALLEELKTVSTGGYPEIIGRRLSKMRGDV